MTDPNKYLHFISSKITDTITIKDFIFSFNISAKIDYKFFIFKTNKYFNLNSTEISKKFHCPSCIAKLQKKSHIKNMKHVYCQRLHELSTSTIKANGAWIFIVAGYSALLILIAEKNIKNNLYSIFDSK